MRLVSGILFGHPKERNNVGPYPIQGGIDLHLNTWAHRAVSAQLLRVAILYSHQFCSQQSFDGSNPGPVPRLNPQRIREATDLLANRTDSRRCLLSEFPGKIGIVNNHVVSPGYRRGTGDSLDLVQGSLQHAEENLEMTELRLVEKGIVA